MSTSILKTASHSLAPVSDVHRWLLASVMVATIAFGWIWPILGFTVPVAMFAGIGGSFLRGRYVCGNFCPRGSFYDTFFRFFGGDRPVPPWLSRMDLRWGMATLLMSLMAFQIAQDPSNPLHWGRVFWLVCFVTTGAGIMLGIVYSPRTWCTFCPVGTMANSLGGEKYRLLIGEACVSCGVCEKSCPMGISLTDSREDGHLHDRDCIKCSSCVVSCKRGALSFPQ